MQLQLHHYIRLLVVTQHKKCLSNTAHPQLKGSIDVGFSIETIYSYKDKLFIGPSTAMYVYSLTDPAHPDKLGQAQHVRACDPVVANDYFISMVS